MQLGFHIDQTRCTGCCTCRIACKDWNDIPAGPASWGRVTSVEEGEWPDLFLAYSTSSCYHCSDPACVDVCPAKAILKREEDGIVVVDRLGSWNTRTADAQHYYSLWLGNYLGHDAAAPCVESGDAYTYWDNAYIDTSWAHVELGNAATYAASTLREIQVPTAWSPVSIQVTVNGGSLATADQAVVYVTDANGVVNATGFPVCPSCDLPPDTTAPAAVIDLTAS